MPKNSNVEKISKHSKENYQEKTKREIEKEREASRSNARKGKLFTRYQ